MNEFQFNCPKCCQNILVTAKWCGRSMTCPSCETRIIIPAPALTSKKGTRSVGIEAPPPVRIRVKPHTKAGAKSSTPGAPAGPSSIEVREGPVEQDNSNPL